MLLAHTIVPLAHRQIGTTMHPLAQVLLVFGVVALGMGFTYSLAAPLLKLLNKPVDMTEDNSKDQE